MSGETEKQVSGWTTDTLHELLISLIRENDVRYGQRFAAQQEALNAALVSQEKAVAAALSAADRAVQKAEVASEKRFDSVNEFRAALSDQTARLMPRTEVDGLVRALNERVDVQVANLADKIDALRQRADRLEGRSSGVAEVRTERRANGSVYISAVAAAILAVGLIVSIVALILKP